MWRTALRDVWSMETPIQGVKATTLYPVSSAVMESVRTPQSNCLTPARCPVIQLSYDLSAQIDRLSTLAAQSNKSTPFPPIQTPVESPGCHLHF